MKRKIVDVAIESATKLGSIPLEPTNKMIDAGAKRLVRWETGKEKWPDAWDKLQVLAARNEAERVWRSMWIEAALDWHRAQQKAARRLKRAKEGK